MKHCKSWDFIGINHDEPSIAYNHLPTGAGCPSKDLRWDFQMTKAPKLNQRQVVSQRHRGATLCNPGTWDRSWYIEFSYGFFRDVLVIRIESIGWPTMSSAPRATSAPWPTARCRWIATFAAPAPSRSADGEWPGVALGDRRMLACQGSQKGWGDLQWIWILTIIMIYYDAQGNLEETMVFSIEDGGFLSKPTRKDMYTPGPRKFQRKPLSPSMSFKRRNILLASAMCICRPYIYI